MKKNTIILFILLANSSYLFPQSGYELRFDGDDDYVEISGLLGNQRDISLSVWAKVSSDQRGELISLGDHVAIRLNDSNWGGSGTHKGFFYKSGGGWHATGVDSTLSPGWHFFTYTNYDSSSFSTPSYRIQKFYIDGNQVARSAHTSLINYSGLGTNTRIGMHGSNNTYADFHGSISEVAVWGSGLDSLEVLTLFNNGTPLDKQYNSGNYSSSDKLIAYWKFSEGTGTTLGDATVNDHDGTIIDATWNPRYSDRVGNLKVKGFDVVGDRLYAVHPGTYNSGDKAALISIINLNTNAVIASGGELSTTAGGFNGYPDQIAVFGQVGIVGEDLKMFDFSQDKVDYMCRNILSTEADCNDYNYLSNNSMHMQKYKNQLYITLKYYGFAVFDMSDPKNPVTLHMKDYELQSDYPYGIHANDEYIFVCDIDGNGKIYIHKNGGDFEKLGTINTKAYRAATHGDLLYTDHKKVFDISDPANPVELTSHNYTGESSNGEMRIYGDYVLISGGGHKSWNNPRASVYNIKDSSDVKLAYTFDDTLPSYDIKLTKDKLYVSFGTQGTDMGSIRIYNNKFVDPAFFNSQPVIASISDTTIKEDENITITLSATDADNDPITFSIKENYAERNYLNFDGVDDWVQTKNQSGEEDHPIKNQGNFTVSAWAKASSLSSGLMEIVSQGRVGKNFYLGSHHTGDIIRAGDLWENTGVTFPRDDQWHHYVLSKSASNTYLYLDGSLVAAKGSAISNPDGGTGLRIGRQYGTAQEYFYGGISEVATWDDTLSAIEVKSLYNGSSILSPMRDTLNYKSADAVTVYYPINEGSGSSTYGKEDNSSEVFTGIINGDADWKKTKVESQSQVTATISGSTLSLAPDLNWNGKVNYTVSASDTYSASSTNFKLTVSPVQDAPAVFEWVSSLLDTINISKTNTTDIYKLEWTESKDLDGESINYILYARIGDNLREDVHDTTSTSVPITYQEFADSAFEPFPMLPRVTVKFSVSATDGKDTVKVTGDDRVVFVNRYDYLSTEKTGIPTEFVLHENYPNPFNPTTTLRFDLPEVTDVTVTIFNMLGQKVKKFNMNDTPAGYHSIKWDATNDYGDTVGAGVYLYQLRANQFIKTKKMVLLK